MIRILNLTIVLMCCANLVLIECVLVPENPCPKTFRYLNNGNFYYGEILVPTYGESEFHLNVNFTFEGRMKLKTKLDLQTSIEEICKGRPLKYYVYFSILQNNWLPKITNINFNGNTYCIGANYPILPNGNAVGYSWAYSYYKAICNFNTIQNPTIIQKPINQRPDFGVFVIPTQRPVIVFQSAMPVETTPITTSTTTKRTTTTEKSKRTTQENIYSIFSFTSTKKSEATTTKKAVINPVSRFPTFQEADECGIANTATRLVINGERTVENEFPWLVALYSFFKEEYQYRCTANLISQKHVVTAAHCVQVLSIQHIQNKDMLFLLGKSNISNWNNGIIRGAQSTKVHPDYKYGSGHCDIAIITLNATVSFTRTIRPICMWSARLSHHLKTGTVAGWGKDNKGTRSYVTEANKIDLVIVTQEECLRSNSAYITNTSNQTFCAGSKKGSGPCVGDSGAGFMIPYRGKFFIRGIVSISLAVQGSCDTDSYYVFDDVSKQHNWIKAVIET